MTRQLYFLFSIAILFAWAGNLSAADPAQGKGKSAKTSVRMPSGVQDVLAGFPQELLVARVPGGPTRGWKTTPSADGNNSSDISFKVQIYFDCDAYFNSFLPPLIERLDSIAEPGKTTVRRFKRSADGARTPTAELSNTDTLFVCVGRDEAGTTEQLKSYTLPRKTLDTILAPTTIRLNIALLDADGNVIQTIRDDQVTFRSSGGDIKLFDSGDLLISPNLCPVENKFQDSMTFPVSFPLPTAQAKEIRSIVPYFDTITK